MNFQHPTLTLHTLTPVIPWVPITPWLNSFLNLASLQLLMKSAMLHILQHGWQLNQHASIASTCLGLGHPFLKSRVAWCPYQWQNAWCLLGSILKNLTLRSTRHYLWLQCLHCWTRKLRKYFGSSQNWTSALSYWHWIDMLTHQIMMRMLVKTLSWNALVLAHFLLQMSGREIVDWALVTGIRDYLACWYFRGWWGMGGAKAYTTSFTRSYFFTGYLEADVLQLEDAIAKFYTDSFFWFFSCASATPAHLP